MELLGEYREVNRVVVLGMGGSAIGGDYLQVLLSQKIPVPVVNHRDCDLPPHVDERTLLIASSYSGDREETLSAFEAGLRTGAKKVVITTGGRLFATAQANGVPSFTFRYS